MRASHTVSVITLFALTALPSLGQGQVYSWKDASGKIHYGDRPPAERSADSRKLPPAPSATVAPETARKAGAEHEKQQTEAGDGLVGHHLERRGRHRCRDDGERRRGGQTGCDGAR